MHNPRPRFSSQKKNKSGFLGRGAPLRFASPRFVNPRAQKVIIGEKENADCYYYYYSSCSKGDNCPFRHEPAAMGSETVCEYWIQGMCNVPKCEFRHMQISKQRKTIKCFHESQPGGCQKPHCPFLHSYDEQNSDSDDYQDTQEEPSRQNSGRQRNQRGSKSCVNLIPIQNPVTDKTKWSSQLCGNVPVAEICFNSVESLCSREVSGCNRLHSSKHFHWQVKESTKSWMNLPVKQSSVLESKYGDPSINEFDLPPLVPKDDDFKELFIAMKGRSVWNVNFDKMSLVTQMGDKLELRRLATENVQHKVLAANTFIWYFLDENDRWVEYGQADSTRPCFIKSSDMEKFFIKDAQCVFSVTNDKFTYEINAKKMIQTNVTTQTKRPIRRRPKCTEKPINLEKKFPQTWDEMKPDVKVMKVQLSNTSPEYKKVESFIKLRQGNFVILKIERIQNQFMYFAFQNKIKQMKTTYANHSDINIQWLFHGTKDDLVDAICEQNFDWRLHGSRSGQSYGRGTYFSTSAMYSYSYAQLSSNRKRYLFIANVAVGSLVAGNSSMVRPPLNPKTKALYDSSCDSVSSPAIIVKYDTQEYYPEYIITME